MPTRPPVHVPTGAAALRRARERERLSASRRGYDRTWERFRRGYLAEHPLCADCMQHGVTRAATDVHHVAKIVDSPDRRLDPANLMSLCQECHSTRTGRGE